MWHQWWLACVECSLAGLMLRDSAHSLLPAGPPTKNLQIMKNCRFALGRQQLLFPPGKFLVEKFQMSREF